MTYCDWLLVGALFIVSTRAFLLQGRTQLRRTGHSARVLSSSEEDEYVPEIDGGAGGYVPAMGAESIFFTLSGKRNLLETEYLLAFDSFPGLLNATLAGVWPPASSSPASRILLAKQAAQRLKTPVTDEDLQRQADVFRRVILGVEKYRISNPARIAKKYCEFLSSCLLAPEDAWGCAAYSLEYAGLQIKDHVTDEIADDGDDSDDAVAEGVREEATVPVLDLNSLWCQAAVRLLDLEFSGAAANVDETAVDREARLSTNDQKYFSQIELTSESKSDIRDMMIGIMRVAIRAVLSREGVNYAAVRLSNTNSNSNSPSPSPNDSFLLEPSFSSVKFVLSLDFTTISIDMAGGDGEELYTGLDDDAQGDEDENIETIFYVCRARP